MKKKILVTRDVFQETLDFLSPHFEVTSNQSDQLWDAEQLASRLGDQSGLLSSSSDRIDEKLLARCPALKAVCNIAVGYNNIDVAACTARGIMVTNTPGVLTESTADFAWALLLAAARRVTEAEAYVRAGKWHKVWLKQHLGVDVHGATLGIIGMGRIGQAVARRARGFDMTVLYHNRTRISETLERECNAAYATQAELLARSDFVSLHMPYTAENHHYMGAAELAAMKPSALLVNIARGGIVDDAALIAALRVGRIAGAALDVFENEPRFNPGFLELSNVVLSPHIGSASGATRLGMAMLAAENLVQALTDGNPPNILNPAVLKH